MHRSESALVQAHKEGRSEPDQTARAYLKVIAAAPDAVQIALQVTPLDA